MSTEGDDGPSVSPADPGAEGGGIGGRGSSRKAATAAKYSERSTNSRSLEDTDSVVDEEQPALGEHHHHTTAVTCVVICYHRLYNFALDPSDDVFKLVL